MFDPRKGVKHRAIIRCGAGPAQDRSLRSWSFALEGDARETVALRGIGGVPAAVADSDRLLRPVCHSGVMHYGPGGQEAWQTRAVAIAAMPSPRPVRPRPSVVVADRLTGAPDSAALRTAIASARRGPILGLLPMT